MSTLPPIFIASEIYRHSNYGKLHPLRVPRVSVVVDLCRSLGWLPASCYVESPLATPAELARFHSPDYLQALMQAEATQTIGQAERVRFRIGAEGNPVFPEIFRRPATGAGGVLLAARRTVRGGVAFVPGGGTHHGRPDRASGFCYLNDPVLGILAWLDQGLDRIAYVDIDAHHGDGVQDAFHGDSRVLVLSVHEAGRWPRTGAVTDRGGGNARNFPVPAGFNDSEFLYLLHQAILPLVRAHQPQAIFLQCGADALEEDPLARLSLSNQAHRAAVAALRHLAPRFIVTGGGGYNPFSTARCWTCVWAELAGHDIPEQLPAAAERVLRGIAYHHRAGRNPPGHWFTTLQDAPRLGIVRPEMAALAAAALKEPA